MAEPLDTQAITLRLSLADDGALQQALSLGNGRMVVGETPQFLLIFASETTAGRRSPFASRIKAALQTLHERIRLEYPPELAHLPWQQWLQAIHPEAIMVTLPQASWTQRGHRQVTSLSYDLVDSTALMATLGPETYALLLGDFHAQFAGIAKSWDALVDQPQGDDGCMCYFGVSTADEHAARAALLAGLRMRDAARMRGWKVRIGIASGWVAVDAGQPVGLSVHLAARLQKSALAGTVLVSEELAQRYGSEFEVRHQSKETMLKGFADPLGLVELVAPSRRPMGHAGKSKAADAPVFVGRETLLAQLDAAWLATQNGQGCDVLIQGTPGMGKSSLVHHWRYTLQGTSSFVLFCGPHDHRQPFASLSQWIAREIGFVRSESREAAQPRLMNCLARHPAWKPWQGALEYLFDVVAADQPGLFEDVAAQHQQVLHAMTQWMLERAHSAAVLLVIEDYQWMDASSAAWVEQLRSAIAPGQRIMLLVTQRTASEQTYVARDHAHTLEPLSASQSRQVIATLSPSMFSDAHLCTLVAERAQGVPLFLRESVRLFNSPEYQQQLQTAQRLGVGLPVPGSLQELLMQRMDQLGTSREMAQIGSVLGQEFPQSLLHAVVQALQLNLSAQTTPQQACQHLLHDNIWTEAGSAAAPAWRFTHAMLRDAAYQSMWETDRRRIHGVAAQVLESAAGDDGDARATELARHLAAAGQVDAAVDHLVATGKRSKRKGAHAVATQTLETTLDLLELTAATPQRERKCAEAHLLLAGQKLITQGYGSSAVGDHFLHALRLSQQMQDHKASLRAQLGIQSYHFMRGDFTQARKMLEAAQATAELVRNPLSTLQCDWARANLLFYEGRLPDSVRLMQTCIASCEQHQLGQDLIQNPRVMAMLYQAFSLWCMGEPEKALALADAGRALANQSSNRLARLQAHGIAAMVEYGCGRWKQTLDAAVQAMESCQPGEYALWYAHAGVMQGAALARLGQVEQGLALMRSNHARWAAHGGTLTRSYYWALEAEIQLAHQGAQAALRTLADAKAFLVDIPERYYHSELQRLTLDAQLQQDPDQAARKPLLAALTELHVHTCQASLLGLAQRVMASINQHATPADGELMAAAQVPVREPSNVLQLNHYFHKRA